ncbi:DUF5060 domain-containing protein [Granulicella sp. WH15]|uniref:DUF5060 domain-containing protein n=1 Tax=Granulicella sp. WH15 TaxID=2602070 RepID=UPI001366C36D|nr:DUF5060 domain-containing protein [Granulicella sp. WH15]QHN03014.1 DUF5060 domain-containing protein [Granulicella sp. WH15]
MLRRDLIRFGAASVAATLQPALLSAANKSASKSPSRSKPEESIEQWGLFEASFPGPTTGNPFKDITLKATFTLEHRAVQVTGFYDGEGTYRVRFMPDALGHWTFETHSPTAELNGHTGAFVCTAPTTPGNHGPVTTTRQYHFQYADGTPYFPFGTTTYAYLFTSDQAAAASLAGMKEVHFNKSRVCVMPKPLGKGEQILPFVHTGSDSNGRGGTNDLIRFNPAYFQLVEKRLLELQKANIEADCILFHPYDGWGFKNMGAEADDFYLRYAIARLSAYRNVWWAIANEYDLVKTKTMSDWDRFFRITQAEDPYSHLRSIHHSRVIYDHSKPWCTHASLQTYDFEKSASRREAWGKPIVHDEIQYEGDVDRRWGNLSAEEMTRRFWLATVRGVYASHGEVFISETGESSWSDAGRLRGESGPRIAYLRALVERITKVGLNEYEGAYYLSAGTPNELILYYMDTHRPARYDFPLPTTATFSATLIDPFAMTETPLPGTYSGKTRLSLPSKPYRAVLFQKVSDVKGAKPATTKQPLVPDNEPGEL